MTRTSLPLGASALLVSALGAAASCGSPDRACEETLTCPGQRSAGRSGNEGGEGGESAGKAGASGRGTSTGAGGAGPGAAGESSGTGGASGGMDGDDESGSSGGGTGGSGGKGGAGGNSGGSAGSTGGVGGAPDNCVDSLCCLASEPQTSGPCGTGCTCLGDGRGHESGCADGVDNDNDEFTDCDDSDCADLSCTAEPVTVDVPVDIDVGVYEAQPDASFDYSNINVGTEPGIRQALFFGVQALTSSVEVTYAELRLYVFGHEGNDRNTLTLRAHQVTEPWDETLDWRAAYVYPTDPPLSAPTPTIFDSAIVDAVSLQTPCSSFQCIADNEWYAFDVTSVVQAWMGGTDANHGLAVDAVPNYGPHSVYNVAASEYSDSALRPVLRITYRAVCDPARFVCPTPTD